MKSTMSEQNDLFGEHRGQGELFAKQKVPRRSEHVTPDEVRAKMLQMLDQLKASDEMPWPERTARINEVIFPQMSRWLPEDEAEQLCLEFRREYERVLLAA